MSEKEIHCSIVIPVYFNEGSLRKTYDLLNEKVVGNHEDLNFEIIFIDDGSGDKSLLELLALQSESSMVKVIKLSRNFGQGAAILAGFTHARGRAVVTVAADLHQHLFNWLLGSLLLAPALAVVAGLITFVLATGVQRRTGGLA